MDAQKLKEILDYNPETGTFIWKINKSGPGAKVGRVAGRIKLGYRSIKIEQREFMAHRLAWLYMTGSWPSAQIDHINRERADNRWCNLREATNKQNHENLPMLSSNTSGIRGVRFEVGRGKWMAYITHNQVSRNLGRFDTSEQALAARRKAERELFTHVT